MSVFDEIRAAAFDIDGTLYPNWQMYIWGFPQILFHPRLLHAYVQTRKEIRKIDMKNEKFEDVQARLAAVKLELLPSRAAEKIENRLYQPWAKQTRIIRPVKGLRPFLEELKTRGVALYALSDFPSDGNSTISASMTFLKKRYAARITVDSNPIRRRLRHSRKLPAFPLVKFCTSETAMTKMWKVRGVSA